MNGGKCQTCGWVWGYVRETCPRCPVEDRNRVLREEREEREATRTERIRKARNQARRSREAKIDRAIQAAGNSDAPVSAIVTTSVKLPDDWIDLEYIGYIAHVDNITSILEHGILSYEAAGKYPHKSMADTDVQARRTHQIPGTGLTIHDHAIAYINPRNAMMYRLTTNVPLTELAVLRLDARGVLGLPHALISNQNAATDGASFYPASTGMSQLDRNQVYAERWVINGVRHDLTMKRMMAEVLVPGAIPSSLITGIDAPTPTAATTLRSRHPGQEVIVNGILFFQREEFRF